MSLKTQKLEPALHSLLEPKIEARGTGSEAEKLHQEAHNESMLPYLAILARDTRRHGIRELKSPLSE